MSNVRRQQRHMLRIAATVVAEGKSRMCLVNDISTGGLGLVSSEPLLRGTDVRLSIFGRTDELEDRRGEPLELHGEVTWCSDREHEAFRVGVRFLDDQAGGLVEALDHILETLEETG